MYVAVKGDEKTIGNAHRLLAREHRGDTILSKLSVEQIHQQMPLTVSWVMTEDSLYDEQLAALVIKQVAGDLMGMIFLLRVYHTTPPRFAASLSLDIVGVRLQRRISATYKDLPGGQLLGPTFDYTHRPLDLGLLAKGDCSGPEVERDTSLEPCPHVLGLLDREDLMTPGYELPGTVLDITREPLDFPTGRTQYLQALARSDEGFLLVLGYSTQRGYGCNHPFVEGIHVGAYEVWLEPEGLDFAMLVGEIEVTEYEMVNQFAGSHEEPPWLTRGYGLALGYTEREAMGMALADCALRTEEYGEEVVSSAQQEEFVLMYCDNVEAGGSVSHLKLPHYVDFQSELEPIHKLRHPGVAESAQLTIQEKRA